MLKALRISFALKNTYRVNGILHSLKQIPFEAGAARPALSSAGAEDLRQHPSRCCGRSCPSSWGSSSTSLTMVCGVGLLYERAPAGLGFPAHPAVPDADRLVYEHQPLQPHPGQVLRHDPSADERPILHPGKLRVRPWGRSWWGSCPLPSLFGLDRGVPLWLCVLIPFCIAGVKVAVAADSCGTMRSTAMSAMRITSRR